MEEMQFVPVDEQVLDSVSGGAQPPSMLDLGMMAGNGLAIALLSGTFELV